MASLTLKEQAYRQLKQKILNGALAPGEFLTERILVDLLQMSRTPIRSALERLEVEGLVNYTANKGIIVPELSIDKAVDIYDIRIALEAHVVSKLASGSLTADHVSWFKANLEEQQRYGEERNVEQFTVVDSAFHSRLAEIHDNKEIIQVIERLQDKLYQIALKVMVKNPVRIMESYQDHTRILESIMHGQAADAAKEMIRHLEFGKRILIT